VCQALASIGMPYSPTIYYTSNNMGRVFFWIFALFPWNPLTKGVLDMSAAASSTTQQGECACCGACSNVPQLHLATAWTVQHRVVGDLQAQCGSCHGWRLPQANLYSAVLLCRLALQRPALILQVRPRPQQHTQRC
jgi:hypothetical protein